MLRGVHIGRIRKWSFKFALVDERFIQNRITNSLSYFLLVKLVHKHKQSHRLNFADVLV